MLFFIHHLMKFSCATVVCISLDVPGTVYDILEERQNGSNNFLLYPSKLDLYAQCTLNILPSFVLYDKLFFFE